MSPERVLVLPRERVPGGCDFHGVRAADADDLAELRAAVGRARPLSRSARGGGRSGLQAAHPVRRRPRRRGRSSSCTGTDAGGDARLHGKASIGVGGHLNPVDDGEDALMAGLRREWAEELEAEWEP